jgi:hypothetical protein
LTVDSLILFKLAILLKLTNPAILDQVAELPVMKIPEKSRVSTFDAIGTTAPTRRLSNRELETSISTSSRPCLRTHNHDLTAANELAGD